jgi:hypothetical protein
MDPRPVVFALILGWISGDEKLPADFSQWLTARETIGNRVAPASCSFNQVDFVLKQVVLDQIPVSTAQPDSVSDSVP